MSNIKLSVVIPAYNESKRISKTLLDIDKYLSEQDYDYEIMVMDDGSKDDTVEVVRKFEPLINGLRVIASQENHGKGYSVKKGMLEAQGQYRLFMDADNATTIDHLEKIWPVFAEGFDVVIGSRDPKDAKGAKQAVAQPLVKRILGNMGNILIQLLAVWGVWDTQCGFKVFKAEAAEDVFKRSLIERWGFDIEVLALAKRLKYKIGIIPVNWVNDPNSKVGWRGYVRTLSELLKIKWNLILNKYNL